MSNQSWMFKWFLRIPVSETGQTVWRGRRALFHLMAIVSAVTFDIRASTAKDDQTVGQSNPQVVIPRLETAWSEGGLERELILKAGSRAGSDPQKNRPAEIGHSRTEARELGLQAPLLEQRRPRQMPKADRVTEANQTKETDHAIPVMYFFTAAWCTPCREMNPIFERLRREGYLIRSVDIDNEEMLAKKYGISSLPFFLLLIDGKEADHISGTATERQIREMVRQKRMRRERVRAVHSYFGSVADSAIESCSPADGIVSDAETWKELCEAWGIDGMAKVDFDCQFIVVATTRGSGVSMEFEKDCHGSLNYRAHYFLDHRSDGFRYCCAVIDRNGIEALNGKRISELHTPIK